jgi:tetratricopeptide (TPR) repeat protein
LEVAEALELAVQLASGLARAHERDIVHRDIKPGNVMLTDGGKQAKLMDFGLAKKPDATQVTRTGTTVGTAAYMSPEQAMGQDTDGRTDVWSLGVTLYEMLSGNLPFRGEVEPALVYSIVNEEPPPVREYRAEVPTEVEEILERALIKDKDKRYQSMRDFLAELETVRDQLALGIKRRQFLRMRRKSRRKLLRIAIPAAAVVLIAILLYLIPRIRPVPPDAIAESNSIAILYFENLADPLDEDRIGEQITSLLTTDLSNSKFMRVVNQQRIYDILKRMGREEAGAVNKQTASEVAQRARVNWVVTGNIIQTEPNLVVTAEVSDAKTGNVKSSHPVRGEPNEDIFSVVDKLSREIRADMAYSDKLLAEEDPSIVRVTTTSPEAWRHFIEGARNHRRLYAEEALEEYKKAVEIDSTFAMAYAGMSRALWLLAGAYPTKEAKAAMAKAVAYSDRVTPLERWRIEAWDAFLSARYKDAIVLNRKILDRDPDDRIAWNFMGEIYRMGLWQNEEAIPWYERAIALDSLDASPYARLAYASLAAGQEEKALWAADKTAQLSDPDDADPHDSRGDIYAALGHIDEAIASYRRAEEIKPLYSAINLAYMYMFNGAYEKSDSTLKAIINKGPPWYRKFCRRCLAYIPMYQGRLDDALVVLDNGIAADLMELKEEEYDKHYLKGLIYMEQDRPAETLAALDRSIELKSNLDQYPGLQRAVKAWFLAQSGQIAAAEKLAAQIKEDVEKTTAGTQQNPNRTLRDYWLALGAIEAAQGNATEAIPHLDKAVAGMWPFNAPAMLLLARAYGNVGRTDNAISVYERLVNRYGLFTAMSAIWLPKARYELGQLYEQSGRHQNAIEQYEKVLQIWRDADPYIEEVADTRARLARLKSL